MNASVEQLRNIFTIGELKTLRHAVELELEEQVHHRDFIRRYSYHGAWDQETMVATEKLYSMLDQAVGEYK